ncbi:MAG: hypothetical protein VZR95_09880, partial [Alphaproteobacteria bacterium]
SKRDKTENVCAYFLQNIFYLIDCQGRRGVPCVRSVSLNVYVPFHWIYVRSVLLNMAYVYVVFH